MQQWVVASQELVINLSRSRQTLPLNNSNYRKIVFPTTEYISTLDFAYHVTSLGVTHYHSPYRNPYSQDYRQHLSNATRICGLCCNDEEVARNLDPAQEI